MSTRARALGVGAGTGLLALLMFLFGRPSEQPLPPIPPPSPQEEEGPPPEFESAIPRFELGASGCDASLWQHVYHPYRLHIVKPCAEATGTVVYVRQEPDGDAHLGLRLDEDLGQVAAGQVLVVEAICVGRITQADARQACAGYMNTVRVPAVGAHVRVRGPFVLDAAHSWLEIHPVDGIVELPS